MSTGVDTAAAAVGQEQPAARSGVVPAEPGWRRWVPRGDGTQPIMDRLLIERGGTL